MHILCWWKHLLAISRILCSIGSNPLLLITIMFEFKNPSSMVYLSQAKTYAFHLPYREGKFVYFICLVLNPVLIFRCNNLTMMGLQRLYLTFWNWWRTWRWEVISWGQSAIFWFFASTPNGSKDSVLLMSLLSSPVEASQFPFVHQELYIVLCWCHGA